MAIKRMLRYRAASGATYDDEQADKIGRALEVLPEITPPAVVEAARPLDAPLHPFFEWRDEQAAEKYRQWQARTIINHLVVLRDGEAIKAFHNVTAPAGEGAARQYLHIDSVRGEPEDAAQVLEDAMAELEGWLDRYNRYSRAFGDVFGEVNEAVVRYRERRKTG